MRRLRLIRRARIQRLSVLGGGLLAVLAVVLFIPSASAATLVQLQSPAYLRSGGAAVETSVLVVCTKPKNTTVGAASTPTRATLTVTLSEKVGKALAGGTGVALSKSGAFRCDGQSHYVTVFVLATPGSRAFVKGNAFGHAELKVCSTKCNVVTDDRTIKLTK